MEGHASQITTSCRRNNVAGVFYSCNAKCITKVVISQQMLNYTSSPFFRNNRPITEPYFLCTPQSSQHERKFTYRRINYNMDEGGQDICIC